MSKILKIYARIFCLYQTKSYFCCRNRGRWAGNETCLYPQGTNGGPPAKDSAIVAKYIRQQVSNCIGGENTQHYYRLEHTGTAGIQEIAHRIGHAGSSLSETAVIHVLTALPDVMAELMADGQSVKLDGIGTFRAKLGLDRFKEKDEFEAESEKSHRNARSINVTGVNYRADKDLVGRTRYYCHPTKGGDSAIRKSTLTKEERVAMAKIYMDEHGIMRVANYEELTGLSHNDATKELRELRYDPTSGISASGNRSALVYFKTPLSKH